MGRKLPAELRDDVYTFICIEDRPIEILPSRLNRPLLLHELSLWKRYDNEDINNHFITATLQPDSYVLDPRNVGPKAALEISKSYYSRNVFDISVGLDEYAQVLSRFLTAPPYLKESVKPFELVRKVVIRGKLQEVPKLLDKFKIYRDERDSDGEIDLLEDWQSSMRDVALIEHTDRLRLEFVLETNFHHTGPSLFALREFSQVEKLRCLLHFLEMLRQPIYDLIHAGAKVTVTLKDDWNAGRPKDLTHFFSLTGQMWAEVCGFDHEVNLATHNPI